MHADTATRQHWMSVLAHSQPAELAARLNALNITADYEVIRAAETGLVQIQARMGGTGEHFFAGDATLTRAARYTPQDCHTLNNDGSLRQSVDTLLTLIHQKEKHHACL